MAVILAAACMGVIALTRAGSTYPDLPLLLVVAVVAALATGSREQLSPGAERNASSLRGVFRRLLENHDVKVAPWARVPSGRTEPDLVRLLVVPRAPIPGLLGIEVATAWERRLGAFVPWASVLVRVHEDTPACGKMAANGAAPILPGRRPEERVFRFEPTWPTDASAALLASQLATSLVDRRVQGECIYSGRERREADVVRWDEGVVR